jgi:hypothetical protein
MRTWWWLVDLLKPGFPRLTRALSVLRASSLSNSVIVVGGSVNEAIASFFWSIRHGRRRCT